MTMSIMSGELIVNFPTHRARPMRSVQFANTMEMYIVDRHGDNQDVDRRDLWYNKSDYSREACHQEVRPRSSSYGFGWSSYQLLWQ